MIRINQNGCKCYGGTRDGVKEAFNFSISFYYYNFRYGSEHYDKSKISSEKEYLIADRALNFILRNELAA